ncbi:RecQ family ATP-dependent DNA helicase [Persicobacter sp. CCB-QB2]|uniref:RecQ family ATP-dependent DNA helicase n=1 Tax=Persicobacter sp. CCB-QB2 TaxID=1561025 RepID=UPI0006A974BB|nr:RecQ family ATP-dependent DNA helicase [Persicobacter sp. CCB-QB2]
MEQLTFIDLEISPQQNKILDIGAINTEGQHFHEGAIGPFFHFLSNAKFIVGHNILRHDFPYLSGALSDFSIYQSKIIDTLFLSPLLFPKRPYHALLKDDKLQTEELNNPLNDAKKARDLFWEEVNAFRLLPAELQQIYFQLLQALPEYAAFFQYIKLEFEPSSPLIPLIREYFRDLICENSTLEYHIQHHPLELAFCLALIQTRSRHSVSPPWVLKNYPKVEQIMRRLQSTPCLSGCAYCHQQLDIHRGLKEFFGYDEYRTFDGEALQAKAVQAAVYHQSLLAVFPTGGGKSITFQVPALMAGANERALTVVISPLQSLMKDQVDNLEKSGITVGVTINGLLDPIERAKSIERVADGSACLLYISPESLRSRTIENLLLGRNISRFVIDEAHCFSSWGQDFRVDYLYIGDFIQKLQQIKNLEAPIAVSCFTATARQKVIEDIQQYFEDKLGLELELFTAGTGRKNLHYQVFEKPEEEEKYQAVRDLLAEKKCPSIIYVSRTRRAYELAERLSRDGFPALAYHGKMPAKEKTTHQNAFIAGEIPTIVATSAFGMGVDKKDVGMVIHYEISDSLENYVQEAGRAGRDQSMEADCFVLFNEEDLGKHFVLLNQTKLSIREIQQVWKAIKDITRFRGTVSNSALEIARKAGWDDSVMEIETRVTTAIAALEEAGYLRRGQNMPRVFANSIRSKNANEAIEKINQSEKFNPRQKEKGARIIKKLISSRSRKEEDGAESRIDYISDHLGIVKEEVINIINLLREEDILADAKDLTAYVPVKNAQRGPTALLKSFSKIELFLSKQVSQEEQILHLKNLNEEAELADIKEISPQRIKTILNFWAIKNRVQQKRLPTSANHIATLSLYPPKELKQWIEKRQQLAAFILSTLVKKSLQLPATSDQREVLVEFSVQELRDQYEYSQLIFGQKTSIAEVEEALFFLSKINCLQIEGGFMVAYNRLTIERLETDNLKRYTKNDYQKLQQFYDSKVQAVHIVGEYARKMIDNYHDALQFVEDYFQLEYRKFLKKYFPGSRLDELQLKMTPKKFRELFGELSPAQLDIIKDNESKHLVVPAGPGSGKTRLLVHKLASLLLMEDVKHEQLLMVTFSRAAATEFKKRLLKLIGNAAGYIEIKTFHSFCFDLLGKMGDLEKSQNIIQQAVEKINAGEVEPSRMTKSVLVIDEAQDMDEQEFQLIQALMRHNDEMRVIAVGDDDQNIYEFRGASAQYLEQFIHDNKAIRKTLLRNYRSKANLVDFSNQFAQTIGHRLKQQDIVAHQTDFGEIKLTRYQHHHLFQPVTEALINGDIQGSTCLLCISNKEALQLTGLLRAAGLSASLIQTNEHFHLQHLVEIDAFLQLLKTHPGQHFIANEHWEQAKTSLKHRFSKSDKLGLCLNILKDFEATNPKTKYLTDLEVFLKESRLEDFYSSKGSNIYVSTIHKAKGKEFDNVFLMLDHFVPKTDADKRMLYVGLTRAKKRLEIHYHGDYFESIQTANLQKHFDRQQYPLPKKLIKQLNHREIWISFAANCQPAINRLQAGDTLLLHPQGCHSPQQDTVVRFSKSFLQFLQDLQSKGYKPHAAKVNFIVHHKEDNRSYKIVLPEITFKKNMPVAASIPVT